jgi:hypothetical protein
LNGNGKRKKVRHLLYHLGVLKKEFEKRYLVRVLRSSETLHCFPVLKIPILNTSKCPEKYIYCSSTLSFWHSHTDQYRPERKKL